MKHLIIKLLISGLALLGFSASAAPTLQTADSLYGGNRYKAAADAYEQILKKQGHNAVVYYNLGNAYYRQNEYAKAILNYERALWLDPSNEDAAYNLSVARSKASVPQVNASEMFFITWADRFIRHRSADTWGCWVLLFLSLTLCCLMSYLFGRRIWLRKSAFAAMSLSLLCTVFCVVAAAMQSYRFSHEVRAVVMESTPFVTDSGETKRRVLPPGVTVLVTDRDVDGRWCVSLPGEGITGWADSRKLQTIHD